MFNFILFLIYIKLIFSYLTVQHGWWLRDVPTNAERYNFLRVPADLSNQVEFLIIPLLFLFVLLKYRHVKRLSFVLLIMFFMLILNLCTAALNGVGILASITYSLKIIAPIMFFYAFMIFYRNKPEQAKKTLMSTIKLCLLLTVVGLLFFHSSMNRTTEQWPVYFGGIHTHSYVLASVFIGITYMLYRKGSKQTLMVFLFFSFLIIYFGYNVRTASILYLLFILAILYLKHDLFKYVILKVMIFVPLFLMLLFLVYDSDTLNRFSSGRLNMYADKFEMLSKFSILDIGFGKGYGSDFIRTESWWWSEKGSHSDFLTFTIENGIIYLVLFLILVTNLFKSYLKPNLFNLTIIIGYLFSSLISNGIAVRPLAAYVFFMVFAYIQITFKTKSKKLHFENAI